MGNIMYIPEVNEKTEVGCNLIKNTECVYNFMENTIEEFIKKWKSILESE